MSVLPPLKTTSPAQRLSGHVDRAIGPKDEAVTEHLAWESTACFRHFSSLPLPSSCIIFPSPENCAPLMPCHYVIHKQERLVVSTGSGRVTFLEMKVHQCQLLNDPDFNPEFNQLVEGTAVTALELSVDEAKELARRTLFSATSRRAFVASSPAVYGMMRLLGSYHEMSKAPSNMCAFYDLPSALNWLNHESLPDSTETKASRSDRSDAGQDERIA